VEKKQLAIGLKAAMPIVIGYAPLGFAFGVLASESGLTAFEAGLMSLLVLSGSGQFIAVSLLGAGYALSTIIVTTFLVNLRYLLLSASLAPHVRKIATPLLAMFSFWITDETFAVAVAHFTKHEANKWYLFGLDVASHLSWILCSILGAAVGNLITDAAKWGLDFALPAMFICLLIIQISNKMSILVAVIAAVVSVVIAMYVESSINIIVATIIAATLGVMIKHGKRSTDRNYRHGVDKLPAAHAADGNPE